MSFMIPEIIEQSVWILETNIGTEIVPTDVQDLSEKSLTDDDDDNAKILTDTFHDYIEGNRVYSGERKEQWTARLSAPGFLDATDMSGFDTEIEAIEYILDTYGNSETPEDWESELIDRLKELESPSYAERAGALAEALLQNYDLYCECGSNSCPICS